MRNTEYAENPGHPRITQGSAGFDRAGGGGDHRPNWSAPGQPSLVRLGRSAPVFQPDENPPEIQEPPKRRSRRAFYRRSRKSISLSRNPREGCRFHRGPRQGIHQRDVEKVSRTGSLSVESARRRAGNRGRATRTHPYHGIADHLVVLIPRPKKSHHSLKGETGE